MFIWLFIFGELGVENLSCYYIIFYHQRVLRGSLMKSECMNIPKTSLKSKSFHCPFLIQT